MKTKQSTLDRLRRYLAKATPGPWNADGPSIIITEDEACFARDEDIIAEDIERGEDCEIIVRAVNALPDLLDDIASLRAALQPLAELADAFDVKRGLSPHDDNHVIASWCVVGKDGFSIERELTVGMLRNARRVIGEGE